MIRHHPFSAPALLCVGLSFIISLLLLVGPINQDFYGYYYVGRAVVWGRDMYADVAENKGPVSYLFFAFLYALFGLHYEWSLVLGSTLLDGLSGIFLLLLSPHWTGYELPKIRWKKWASIGLLISLIKCFSINPSAGGIFAEQIGMPLLLASFWLWEEKKSWQAGVLFVLSVLARQSLAAFILVFVARSLSRNKFLKELLYFGISGGIMVSLFLLFFWWTGSLPYMIENTVTSIWWYVHASRPGYWSSVGIFLFSDIRLIVVVLFLAVWFFTYYSKLKLQTKRLVISVGISTILALFGGGLVYNHHGIQLIPLLSICLFWQKAHIKKPVMISRMVGILFLTIVGGYVHFIYYGSTYGSRWFDRIPVIAELAEKRYMVVVPFYARFNIDYKKESPDRYYNPAFAMSRPYFGEQAVIAINRHRRIPAERVKETAFVLMTDAASPIQGQQWYLRTFQKDFHLRRTNAYVWGNTRIEVYMSNTTL